MKIENYVIAVEYIRELHNKAIEITNELHSKTGLALAQLAGDMKGTTYKAKKSILTNNTKNLLS
jgi:hypothetical protein